MGLRVLGESLKARLTAFVLGVMLVAMGVGIVIPSLVAARALRTQANDHLAARATDLQQAVSSWFNATRDTLRLMASSPEVLSLDGARQQPLLAAARATYPDTFLIMTTDRQGTNVARSDGGKPNKYGDRKYIKEVLAGAPLASEVVISKTIQKPVVTLATGLRDAQGELAGTLTSVTELTRLAQSIGATRLGDTGLAYLVDSNDKVVAHPESAIASTLADFSKDEAVVRMRQQRGGNFTLVLHKDPRSGKPTRPTEYLVHSALLDNGWGVVVMQQRQEAYAEVTRFVRTASLALIASLLLVGALMWWFIARTLRPIEGLNTAAHSLAAGKLSERVRVRSQDEIGQLSGSFNQMAQAIEDHVAALAAHQASLEETVRQRTAELARRGDEMRLVLDNVDQGLVTLERDGTLGAERSAAFDRWFEDVPAHAPLSEALAPEDENLSLSFVLGWETLIEDVLPIELCLEQLPRLVEIEHRKLALAYRPILVDGKLDRVLLIVTDVTAELQRAAAETEQKELLAAFERVSRDRSGFIEFFNESAQLVEHLAHPLGIDTATLMRELHTLKGNAAIYGVTTVAERCHALESLVADEGYGALSGGVQAVIEAWNSFAARIVPLMGTESDEIVEVPYPDLNAILEAVQSGRSRDDIGVLLDRLRTEPIEVRFQRLAEQARALARRLGRTEPAVIMEPNGVRLPREGYGALFGSFIHLIRNAVDHGLEAGEERLAAKKSDRGHLYFRAQVEGGFCVIEIQDDGRGIDWEQVKHKAGRFGLPHSNRAELTEALFTDGLSTRDEASATSGRGAGMGAVREACHAMGGKIELSSEHGHGTTVRVRVPLRALPPSQGTLRAAVRATINPQPGEVRASLPA